MINQFALKETFALLIPQFITCVGFMMILPIYGFLLASLIALLLMIVGVVVGKLILKNPFNSMLKSQGIITLPIDSKGIATPFLCKFNKGFLTANFDGQEIKAPFDRKAIFNLGTPEEGKIHKNENGDLFIKVSKEEYNKGRFGFYHYPMLLYNTQISSFITKDWLNQKETDTFARHHIIHANKIAQELTKEITKFGRYIADNAMNKFQAMFENPIVRTAITVLIVGLVGFLLIKFVPQILSTGGDAISTATTDVATGGAGNTIIPK